jgi:hypothetical protein
MTLHIFNPEHDIALASGLANFTAPHAGRVLRHDLGYLPALWASQGDTILVDDPEYAVHALKKLDDRLYRAGLKRLSNIGSLTFHPISQNIHAVANNDHIEPWGWNSALRALLRRRGVDSALLPSEDQLEMIRNLSHRRTAARLLPLLREQGTVGESVECASVEEVEDAVGRFGKVVLKAPWSSSGRGLRFVDDRQYTVTSQHVFGWLRNVLSSQGSVMAEPLYNKVKDFGMEFLSDGEGTVSYLGLSLFQTQNGAYTGNVLTTETAKETLLCQYVSPSLLRMVREVLCHELGKLFCGKYQGPFGVDMMITSATDGFMMHPCVEINLRRTMGHTALMLSPDDEEIRRVMRIDYQENAYTMRILRR